MHVLYALHRLANGIYDTPNDGQRIRVLVYCFLMPF